MADLDTFVTTGEVPDSLRWYVARLTEEQRTRLRTILTTPLAIEPTAIASFFSIPFGDTLLRCLQKLMWGGPDEDSLVKAMRASLILAAADEEGLTAINVMRHYPLSQLRIDVGAAIKAVREIGSMTVHSDSIFAAISQTTASEILTAVPESSPVNLLDPGQSGNYGWEKQEIAFTSPTRDSTEQVRADVYLPDRLDAPAPLVVISHGIANSRNTFTYLAEHLVSHGFAVASLQHPDTDSLRFRQYFSGRAQLPNSNLFVQRPNDITALLNELEQKGLEDQAWQGRIRTDGVGVFGHSLGGYTALAAGGAELDFEHLAHSCQNFQTQFPPNLSLLLQCQLQALPEQEIHLRDDRVAAVFAVSPIGGSQFGPRGMSQIDVPVAVVAASHDRTAPALAEQIVPFTWLETEDRYLLLVDRATHNSFLADNFEILPYVPKEFLGSNRGLARPVIKWASTAFFTTHINNSIEHEDLLAAPFLPSQIGDFRLALTRSFNQTDLEAVID